MTQRGGEGGSTDQQVPTLFSQAPTTTAHRPTGLPWKDEKQRTWAASTVQQIGGGCDWGIGLDTGVQRGKQSLRRRLRYLPAAVIAIIIITA